MSAHLKYNIAEAMLYGKIENLEIREFAGSGGRSMTKTRGAENWLLENNWEMTFVKKTKDHPGGPLPRGRYKMVIHESRANWIRLIPLAGTYMGGRDGMAIHGRGPRGSDGCIVPLDFNVVLKLVQKLKEIDYNPILEVIVEGDLTYSRT